ncbi:MAG: KOW domain-containing RNA-binding protein [Firmicutes bacterium]|nr:KOW domain-containing RNA-binding protein [Bacillota bacterium]MDD4791550.1 KOW domain-containing RNA-binding protein [Bacillota bacterium]
MSSGSPLLGQFVISKMGRDKGRLFVIVGLEENGYACIADGDTHKVSEPKRKNVKHLIVTRQVDEDIRTALEAGNSVTDEQLVTALRVYRPQDGKEGDA